MAERRIFSIKAGGFTLTAEEDFDNDILILTRLEGFDEVPNLDISTAPKLFGSGSYIRSKRLSERSVTAGFFIDPEAAPGNDVRFGILEPIKQAAEAFEDVTITRVWNNSDGTPSRTETLYGLITGVNGIEQYAGGEMAFEINVLCTDPSKVITNHS